jgi:hypothetical protein
MGIELYPPVTYRSAGKREDEYQDIHSMHNTATSPFWVWKRRLYTLRSLGMSGAAELQMMHPSLSGEIGCAKGGLRQHSSIDASGCTTTRRT